jgi:hypothetical protein
MLVNSCPSEPSTAECLADSYQYLHHFPTTPAGHLRRLHFEGPHLGRAHGSHLEFSRSEHLHHLLVLADLEGLRQPVFPSYILFHQGDWTLENWECAGKWHRLGPHGPERSQQGEMRWSERPVGQCCA